MTTTRIGLLGGTFNPVHTGHLIIAEHAADELQLDRVLFVPAQTPPHKPGIDILPAHHRVAMVQRAIAGNDRFEFSDLDLRTDSPSYTSDLVIRIDQVNPEWDLFFVAGADSLRDFPTWHEPETILRHVTLAIANRPGIVINDGVLSAVPGLRDRVRVFPSPLIDISSTDIRDRISQRRSIRYLVPERVRTYIEDHGLYRS